MNKYGMQTYESHFILRERQMQSWADSCQQIPEEAVLDLNCEIHSQAMTQPSEIAKT